MIHWPQQGHHTSPERFDEAKYEYETTEGPRKGHVPPPDGSGWEEIDWVRDEFTDTALWRRLRLAPAVME